MGYLKRITLAAIAVLALTGLLGVSPASATTLEIGGVTQNGAVSLTFSVKAGSSLVLRDTFGFFANTCNVSHMAMKTEQYFSTVTTAGGTKHHPTGAISEKTFGNCAHTVTVHNPGQLVIEWTSGTNGRVYSENTEVTFYSTIHGTHVNCVTGIGTPIGTLTGTETGHATMTINATINCGPHLSSAKWTGTYAVTTPTGLGVSP